MLLLQWCGLVWGKQQRLVKDTHCVALLSPSEIRDVNFNTLASLPRLLVSG
jgi:hypothetical protein